MIKKHNFLKKITNYLNYFKDIKIFNERIKNKNYELIILDNFSKEIQLKRKSNYYSDLNLILEKKNIRYINLFKNFSNKKIEKEKIKKNQIILDNTHNLFFEILLIFKILGRKFYFELFIFLRKIRLNNNSKYFLKKAISLKNIASSSYTLRLCRQIERYIKHLNPKYFVLTIEGNSWEKILIHHIKNKFKDIKIIGVQFSAIYENDYPLKKSIGKIYEPHILICKDYMNYLNIKKLKLFKNSKVIYNNLNIVEKKTKKIKKKFNKIKCLVTPEKNISEILSILDFINDLSIKNKSISFYLRLHPNLESSIVSQVKKKCNKNIIISKTTLLNDLNNCNVLIYRGSSICIDALKKGLRLVYYNNSKFNIDPIKTLEIKNNYFFNIKQFLNILKTKQKINQNIDKYLKAKNQKIKFE